MVYTIAQIAKIVKGHLLRQPAQDSVIEYLLIDSRQVIFPETSLFFALRGARQDGHDFIGEVYRKGVRNFVVSKQMDYRHFEGAHFVIVENAHAALQSLAAYHRLQFDMPVIGITGSNGKTIVKEWLYQLMGQDYRIVRSPKSFNSQVGVPLSVWQMHPEHELAIIEAGISRKGEMQKLAPIIRCTVGVFTNIGEAHSEGFISMEEKLREKLRLFEYAEMVVFCADQELVGRTFEELYPDKKRITWAFAKQADLRITHSKTEGAHSEIHAHWKDRPFVIRIPFTDSASIENAIHCWVVLLHLGYDQTVIAERMTRLEPVAMRLEMKSGIHNCLIINDSYNSDLNSLKIALDFMEQQSAHSKRTLILSDILQSGRRPDQLYSAVAQLIREKRISRLIGIGKAVRVLGNDAGTSEPADRGAVISLENHFFDTTEDFLQRFDFQKFSNETVLIKGARSFAFERIANRLSLKVHKTVLEINLNAIKHNLNVFARHLLPGVKMMVMVKASGYGSGSAEVARLLEFQNVDYLGVAYADEGVDLRTAGIRLPIMVLNPEEATFDALFRFHLEPEIYNLRILRELITAIPEGVERIPVHLKLDTGMHRLGFEPPDIPPLLDLLQTESRLEVRSVFSHLAASEATEHDAFTNRQAALFHEMYEAIASAISYRPLRHILNSAGIVRFPQYQMDMVRLGIGLYGVDAPGSLKPFLQTVHTLKATISQIKQLVPGETVGYNRRGKVDRPKRIATISIGYADGLLRVAGNGNYGVMIHGKTAPVIGNVCMDMTMVDITGIAEAKEGDEVIIFGRELPVENLAERLGTIPYEVFTGIAERVKRVYFEE